MLHAQSGLAARLNPQSLKELKLKFVFNVVFEPPAIFVPRELPMKHRIIKEAYQLIAALVTSYTG